MAIIFMGCEHIKLSKKFVNLDQKSFVILAPGANVSDLLSLLLIA